MSTRCIRCGHFTLIELEKMVEESRTKVLFCWEIVGIAEGLKDIHRFEFRQGMIVKVNSFSGLQVDEVHETNYSSN